MTRAVVVLSCQANREKVVRWAYNLPLNTRVEFKKPKRTLDQNSKMWAMLTEVSAQVVHHGMKYTPSDWKLIFLSGLKKEARMAPNLDGNGFVDIGRSSSDLSKEEMADMIELIYAFGAQHNVDFKDV